MMNWRGMNLRLNEGKSVSAQHGHTTLQCDMRRAGVQCGGGGLVAGLSLVAEAVVCQFVVG